MGKLCKDQLVGKLVAVVIVMLLLAGGLTATATAYADETLVQKLVIFFKGHSQTEIDNAVTQAKRNDLEKLFDAQIATLKDRGVPEQIIEELQSQKNAVVQKANSMTIGEGNIPFLPVIKPEYLGYYGLMAMVKSGGKVGYTYLNSAAIFDVLETPKGLYYSYDIEDGNATRGKSPQDAEKIFKQQSRFPLTAGEVMALTTHTDVLSRHYVWAAGSRYYESFTIRVPFVFLDNGINGIRPKLLWGWASSSVAGWGSASCGSR